MKQLFPTRNVMSPPLLLHALRTQLSMLLAVFKEVNTPARMSFSNDKLWDVFPATQITVDRGSSSKDRQGNTGVIPQIYSWRKTKHPEILVRSSIIVIKSVSTNFSRNSFPGKGISGVLPASYPLRGVFRSQSTFIKPRSLF